MKKLLLLATSTLLLTACAAPKQVPQAMVYINTGAIQCEIEGQTGVQTARLLTDNNIEVSKTQCGNLSNMAVASVCGGTTTEINVHTIPLDKVEHAQDLGFEDVSTLKMQDDLGYNVSDCK